MLINAELIEQINSIIYYLSMGGHGHGDEHPSELDHKLPKIPKPRTSNDPNDPLNFTRKHPLFNLELQKQGPQFSEIDDRREEYIQKYAGKVPGYEIEIPKNLPGLVPKTGPLPMNRLFWRPTMTIERNGRVNVHTPNFNTRSIYPFFFCFLLYGWWGHATFAWYKMRYEDNDEFMGVFYDKLNTRYPPSSKIWLRPG